ncbi:hypothetical protein MZE11_19610, partial [Bacillus amyloliquefaciens]|uniref:hypothetical protein n=1 Tax=Bacillus amyloliquefaciens TaxID=1390 RepID=UPI00211A1D5D
ADMEVVSTLVIPMGQVTAVTVVVEEVAEATTAVAVLRQLQQPLLRQQMLIMGTKNVNKRK